MKSIYYTKFCLSLFFTSIFLKMQNNNTAENLYNEKLRLALFTKRELDYLCEGYVHQQKLRSQEKISILYTTGQEDKLEPQEQNGLEFR